MTYGWGFIVLTLGKDISSFTKRVHPTSPLLCVCVCMSFRIRDQYFSIIQVIFFFSAGIDYLLLLSFSEENIFVGPSSQRSIFFVAAVCILQ